MKTSYIYKITSPSKAVYIGKTTNITKRKKAYKTLHCEGQHKIYNSIVKHGWDSHSFEVLFEGNIDDITLSHLEVYYIGKHNSFYKDNPLHGMNLTLGGDGCRIISHTDETKKKISVSKSNKPKTEAQKQYMLSMKGRKLPKTKDWITKNSESRKKAVIQYTLDDVFIAEWKSATDVQKELGFCRKNLSSCLTNKTKQAYGYKWKYKG